MKPVRLLVLIMLAALAFAADKKDNDSQPGHGPPLTLPEEAVQTEPFTWRYEDPDGKIWTYRRTPFGLVRFEQKAAETSESKKDKESGAPPLEAFDEGDKVRFERLTPFGKHRWVRKKTELTDEEREAWKHALSKKKADTKSADQE